jgi:hypothetical protein
VPLAAGRGALDQVPSELARRRGGETIHDLTVRIDPDIHMTTAVILGEVHDR